MGTQGRLQLYSLIDWANSEDFHGKRTFWRNGLGWGVERLSLEWTRWVRNQGEYSPLVYLSNLMLYPLPTHSPCSSHTGLLFLMHQPCSHFRVVVPTVPSAGMPFSKSVMTGSCLSFRTHHTCHLLRKAFLGHTNVATQSHYMIPPISKISMASRADILCFSVPPPHPHH